MKCAVGKCRQNDGQKSSVSFYSFPKNNKGLKRLWIKFCNRRNTIKTHRERICSLHFKEDDFERNLKYEMGFSNRATPKLKEGAVPTIEAVETEEVTTTFVQETTASIEETTTAESITPRVFTLQENHNRSGNVEKSSTSRTVRMKRSKMRLKSQEPYGSHNFKSDLSSSIYTDEAAIYGQAWACGFRKLSPQQKLFAKKAIDEIIILGQLKALKLNTVPTNVSLLQEHSDEG